MGKGSLYKELNLLRFCLQLGHTQLILEFQELESDKQLTAKQNPPRFKREFLLLLRTQQFISRISYRNIL